MIHVMRHTKNTWSHEMYVIFFSHHILFTWCHMWKQCSTWNYEVFRHFTYYSHDVCEKHMIMWKDSILHTSHIIHVISHVKKKNPNPTWTRGMMLFLDTSSRDQVLFFKRAIETPQMFVKPFLYTYCLHDVTCEKHMIVWNDAILRHLLFTFVMFGRGTKTPWTLNKLLMWCHVLN